ncbi:MAG: cyclic pyranopterin monophosphate synthase MoaC [Spirochaetales bacterium]|nr:cyclic pyranopterin monophosphate synthase MoaC [Spirochaetales bacterium]MCF7939462.1 cyclic pyranopterin monophosphate synthase MoaC [Spirochaetales bacterium]
MSEEQKSKQKQSQTQKASLSHVGEKGEARMVDVSAKPKVRRTARASGRVSLNPETVELIRKNQLSKGDVISAARIAGISGGKEASRLIPLCHPIGIDQITVDLELEDDAVYIEAAAVCTDKTGIEMEALTAVSIAALTVYDMCKAADKEMTIGEIRLIEKTKEQLG